MQNNNIKKDFIDNEYENIVVVNENTNTENNLLYEFYKILCKKFNTNDIKQIIDNISRMMNENKDDTHSV